MSGSQLFIVCLLMVTGLVPETQASTISRKTRTTRSIGYKKPSLKFHRKPEPANVVSLFETVSLECSVSGSPPAIIYWLKDGHRITNDTFDVENSIDRYVQTMSVEADSIPATTDKSLTKSKIGINCAKLEDRGRYTCVAENGYLQRKAETVVDVQEMNDVREVWRDAKQCSLPYSTWTCFMKYVNRIQVDWNILSCSDKEGPTIYMWSDSFIGIEGSTIRLPCRSKGTPKPHIKWYIPDNDQLYQIRSNEKFQILKNGDLIIRDLSWDADMGMFNCRAENSIGSDDTSTFVYSIKPEKKR